MDELAELWREVVYLGILLSPYPALGLLPLTASKITAFQYKLVTEC